MTFILAEDKALKSYLQGMTVSDEKQQNRPVKVWYGYPDVEIRNQEFPFVVIELIGIRMANDRQHSGYITDTDFRGTIATTTNQLYTYEVPVAYDLEYQISAYSRHPLHDRAITFQLFNKFPSKYGHLAVPNDLGTETSYRHMILVATAKRDTADNVNGARRLLNTVYTVRVASEMTPSAVTSSVAQVLSISTTSPSVVSTAQTLYPFYNIK